MEVFSYSIDETKSITMLSVALRIVVALRECLVSHVGLWLCHCVWHCLNKNRAHEPKFESKERSVWFLIYIYA